MTEKLPERVERLEGPDREVDCRIWAALGPIDFDTCKAVVADFSQWQAPFYTASLDAAMSLVPEGWRAAFEECALCDAITDGAESWIWPFDVFWEPDWQLGQQTQRDNPNCKVAFAKTPAIALCAAALKARGL